MASGERSGTSGAATTGLARPLDAATASALLLAAGDIVLLMEPDGRIEEVAAQGGDLAADGVASWTGERLGDLVTVESRSKIAELIADASAGRPLRWRQVAHPLPGGPVPVRYACVAAGDRLIAIGRDLRATAAAQQKLLQAQQSLERDYLQLRQAETRYRLMFDMVEQPMVIVDAGQWRITDANPAAHRLLGQAVGTLVRQPAAALVETRGRDALIAHLGAAVAGTVAPLAVTLRTGLAASLTATPFRRERATALMIRLAVEAPAAPGPAEPTLADVVERMPDAFVLTDARLNVLAANPAFADLARAPSAETVTGTALGDWLGRPGVDLELILAELRKSGAARNVASVLRGRDGATEEVELSAVRVESATGEHFGFVLRGVARRMRDLPPAERDLPRSVEQLTELVGRVSLKEIVRESSDLIERLCIEAALAYTSDNRASAAEILGLSRQGLYSKLHRHGLGNLVDGEG